MVRVLSRRYYDQMELEAAKHSTESHVISPRCCHFGSCSWFRAEVGIKCYLYKAVRENHSLEIFLSVIYCSILKREPLSPSPKLANRDQ